MGHVLNYILNHIFDPILDHVVDQMIDHMLNYMLNHILKSNAKSCAGLYDYKSCDQVMIIAFPLLWAPTNKKLSKTICN